MRKKIVFKIILFFGDIVLAYLSLFLTLSLRYWDFSFPFGPSQLFFPFVVNFSFLYIFWIFFLVIFNFYEIPLKISWIFVYFKNLFIFFFLCLFLGVSFFYLRFFPPSVIPKTILIINLFIFSFLLSLWRLFFNFLFSLFQKKEKVIFLGNQKELKELVFCPYFQKQYLALCVFTNSKIDFLPSFKKISDLEEIIKKENPQFIIWSSEFSYNQEIIKKIFEKKLFQPTNHLSFSSFYESILKKVPLSFVDEIWILENIKENKFEDFLKRVFDIVFSLIGIIFTLVIFPFVFILLKIDSFKEPIIYKQKRIGYKGKIFTLYKFRTIKNSLSDSCNPDLSAVYKSLCRASIIGRFLRRWEIDEFPQFFNILKGDLSFVGPRPEWIELEKIYEKEIPFFSYRYFKKPGMTGWAQINFPAGCGKENASQKLAYDFYYLKNHNLFFDLYIIFKTLNLLFFKSFENQS